MFYEYPKDFKAVEPAPGFFVHAVSGQNLMICEVILQPRSESPLHSHPYEEMAIIIEGAFEMTMGDEKKLLKKGDVFLAPPGIVHGGITHDEKTIMISAFSPPREDYR
jgi:quercetin dioxygenase-like cupin family protein